MFYLEKKFAFILFFSLGWLFVGCSPSAAPAPDNREIEASTIDLIVEEPTATPQPERLKPTKGVDSDGDWVSDEDEELFGSDPTSWDSDGDGSSDFEEIFIVNSDPASFDQDTDDDFIRDVTEKLVGSDPASADEDRDGDGIPDRRELKLGSDPGKIDSDGDLMSDFIELFLTETDPLEADPINSNGFPKPIVEWLPEQLEEVTCEAAVMFSMDYVEIIDPEEADAASNINPGDDTIIKYGIWTNQPTDEELIITSNSPTQVIWSGIGYENTVWNPANFSRLSPVVVDCGETATVAIQALEDDSPFGGIWDMGTWRDDRQIIFDRIPLGFGYTGQDVFTFWGTTHDSDYEYQFTYSFAAQMLSSITNRADVLEEYEKMAELFNTNQNTTSELSTEEEIAQMLVVYLLMGMFDSATSGDYSLNTTDGWFLDECQHPDPYAEQWRDNATGRVKVGRCMTDSEAAREYQAAYGNP